MYKTLLVVLHLLKDALPAYAPSKPEGKLLLQLLSLGRAISLCGRRPSLSTDSCLRPSAVHRSRQWLGRRLLGFVIWVPSPRNHLTVEHLVWVGCIVLLIEACRMSFNSRGNIRFMCCDTAKFDTVLFGWLPCCQVGVNCGSLRIKSGLGMRKGCMALVLTPEELLFGACLLTVIYLRLRPNLKVAMHAIL